MSFNNSIRENSGGGSKKWREDVTKKKRGEKGKCLELDSDVTFSFRSKNRSSFLFNFKVFARDAPEKNPYK